MPGNQFRSELVAALGPQVGFGEILRGIHATDASHYQHLPVCVVTPKSDEEVRTALTLAARHGVPTIARGAATSLSGQTHGEGMILDLSRHFDRILEIDPGAKTVRVQAGLVRDHLNAALKPHGLHFAPDPATSSRATIGGMIGNNSSGTRSILYGKTSDHVLSCKVALADGSIEEFNQEQGPIHQELKRIAAQHRNDITERFPSLMRNVSGYALDAFLQDDSNLSRIFCGSEGTLGILLEATLNVVPLPKHTSVVAVHFHNTHDALKDLQCILDEGPSAVELMDTRVIEQAKINPSTRNQAGFIAGTPGALQLIEFVAGSVEELNARTDRCVANLRAKNIGYAHPATLHPDEQKQIWEVRKLGLGLITNVRGPVKGQAFIEDACLPIPNLAEYVSCIEEICAREETRLILYGHSSVGVLHARPELDLHKPDDIARMRRIAEAAFGKCMELGGSWAGEHGDGIVRGEFVEQAYGPELIEAFRRVKHLFDPHNLLNPGKILNTPPLDDASLLRYQQPGYAANSERSDQSAMFRYREQGGFTAAVEQCNGVGACRKIGVGVMCPSYMATRKESDSTRGRSNALRLAMTGQLSDKALIGDEMNEVMDLCLGCKACKSECPNSVDMSKFKSEVTHQRHLAHGTPRSAVILGNSTVHADRYTGWRALLANGANRNPLFRSLLARLTGIDTSLPLPQFARTSFRKQLGNRLTHGRNIRGRVALYVDSQTNAFEPHIGHAALRLLVDCGYEVRVLFAGDSQRARISQGLLQEAKRDGGAVMQALYACADRPILCIEPSCASSLADDLPDLLDDPVADNVAARIQLIDQFLAHEKTPVVTTTAEVQIHGHCHHKALFEFHSLKTWLPDVEWIEAGCCGMAGSFGYTHPGISKAIGEDRLFPAIRARHSGMVTVANGFSCRHQIRNHCGIDAKHIVEVLRADSGPQTI